MLVTFKKILILTIEVAFSLTVFQFMRNENLESTLILSTVATLQLRFSWS